MDSPAAQGFEQFSYNPSFIVGANEDRHGMGVSGRRQDPFFVMKPTKIVLTPHKKTRSNTFIIEKEKAWEPAGEGVARQIMGYDGQVMLVKVKFEKGL